MRDNLVETTEDAFPRLGNRAIELVTESQKRRDILASREKSLVSVMGIFVGVFVFSFIVDFGLGFTFNDALNQGGNLREETSILGHVIRAISAMAMNLSVMAIVFAFHVTFNKRVTTPKRILAFLVALALTIGIFMVAGSIGYQTFNGLFGDFWNGSGAAPINFDPQSSQNPSPHAVTPFWLRLTSSTMFLGVGVLAALAEVAWLTAREKCDLVREEISRCMSIIALHDKYQHHQRNFNDATEQKKKVEDPGYRYAHARAAVAREIQAAKESIERHRQHTINLATSTIEEWENHKEKSGRAEECWLRAEAISVDSDKVDQLVQSSFPKPGATLPPSPDQPTEERSGS